MTNGFWSFKVCPKHIEADWPNVEWCLCTTEHNMLAVRMCWNTLCELVFMDVCYCYHLASYFPLILLRTFKWETSCYQWAAVMEWSHTRILLGTSMITLVISRHWCQNDCHFVAVVWLFLCIWVQEIVNSRPVYRCVFCFSLNGLCDRVTLGGWAVAGGGGVPLNLQMREARILICYRCIFHGTGNAAQLCQKPSEFWVVVVEGGCCWPPPPQYATGGGGNIDVDGRGCMHASISFLLWRSVKEKPQILHMAVPTIVKLK
jgi:hypothetical protein